jgi:hypothetical protein
MAIRRKQGLLAAGTALLAMVALPGAARAQAQGGPTSVMDGQWHFTLAPYMWFTGIKGDVSVKGLPAVPVDASFSDIWKDFDFGLAGRFQARKDRFGFALDFTYNNLGVPVAASAPVLGPLGLEADVRQLFLEGLAFYRVASGGRVDKPALLDVLVGARYTGTSSQLKATGSAGNQYAGDKRDVQWVDALVGLRFRAPLGSRVALLGRGDVAGFGSKLTWNLEGDLALLVSEHWTLGAGWRHMDIDYDKGSGTDRKLFDLAYDGPRAWFAYAW